MRLSGVHNDTHQDTTPGAGCLLSPPEGFAGSEKEYLAYLRDMYRTPIFRQRLVLLAGRAGKPHRADPVEVTGPYATAAKDALSKIADSTQWSAA